jgi:hypothetical protein
MTIEQFKDTLYQQPFRPFTIRMADGRTFQVVHPDFVARSPTGRTIIVYQPDDSYSVPRSAVDGRTAGGERPARLTMRA